MRRFKKKYSSSKVFDSYVLQKHKNIIKEYGLRNKKQIWITEGLISKYKKVVLKYAVNSLYLTQVLDKLLRLGVIKEKNKEEIETLEIDNFLQRRLQTVVAKLKATTLYHARQLITHGHIKVNATRVKSPSFLVRLDSQITFS